MEVKEMLKYQYLQIVENQIANNDPPETKKTLERLMKQGFSESESKVLIAQCVSIELFQVIKEKKPFNLNRFVKNLNNLPEVSLDK